MTETLAYAVLYIFIFFVGTLIGSFLNVVIWRVPRGIQFVTGRSACPQCDAQIPWYDMVPIFSYLALRGKCRNCKGKISARYPIVEALMGALAVLSFAQYAFSWQALLAAYCAAPLICIAFIDADTMEIPNGLLIALIPPAILSFFLFPEVSIAARLIGMVLVSGFMLFMALVKKGAFGGGDIKLMAVCGFLLAWQGILLALIIALLAAGVYIAVLLAKKKATRKTAFAFGPFLCVGIMTTLLYGEEIIGAYLNLITR